MGNKPKNKAVPKRYSFIFSPEDSSLGVMKLSPEAFKSIDLYMRDVKGYLICDGRRAVFLADGLTLLEGRTLMYDNFGIEASESYREFQQWFAERASIASIEELTEVLTGTNRQNALHLAARLALPGWVSKLLSDGYDVNGLFSFASGRQIPDGTPLSCLIMVRAYVGFSESEAVLEVIRILVEAGARIAPLDIKNSRLAGYVQSASFLEKALFERKSYAMETERHAATI